MTSLLIVFSVLAYALAALLLWYERSWRAPLVIVAGSLTVLVLPFWLQLYRVVGQRSFIDTADVSPTSAAVFGGALVALPVLLFCAGLSRRWWSRHYGLVWIAYIVFVLYFLLIGRLLVGARLVPSIALLGSRENFVLALLALLMAGVSLGMVFTLIGTRDYAAVLAVLAVALSGVLATVLFWGLLGIPLWAVALLGLASLPRTVVLALAVVCGLLVLWGVHLLASVLHAGRRRDFSWG
jgi:hypothetical protein